MGQVISFPKQPRSEIERAIRERISKDHLKIPENLLDQVMGNAIAAAEKWNDGCRCEFSHSSAVNPEDLGKEIDRIAELAFRKGAETMWALALTERVLFEKELALAGYRWPPK